MKKTVLILLVSISILTILEATQFRKHRVNIKALSATKFELTDVHFEHPRIVDFKGKDFFVVSVHEPGSDGRVYAVDKDGTIWWNGRISSGAGGGHLEKRGTKLVPRGGHETNNDLFHVLAKRRFHMSSTHPSKNGVNNMDFEIQFTRDGQALHLGNIAMMSHGCIHVARQDIAPLFKWAKVGMPVIIIRGHYKQFLKMEIDQFNEDVREYSREMGIVQ